MFEMINIIIGIGIFFFYISKIMFDEFKGYLYKKK